MVAVFSYISQVTCYPGHSARQVSGVCLLSIMCFGFVVQLYACPLDESSLWHCLLFGKNSNTDEMLPVQMYLVSCWSCGLSTSLLQLTVPYIKTKFCALYCWLRCDVHTCDLAVNFVLKCVVNRVGGATSAGLPLKPPWLPAAPPMKMALRKPLSSWLKCLSACGRGYGWATASSTTTLPGG